MRGGGGWGQRGPCRARGRDKSTIYESSDICVVASLFSKVEKDSHPESSARTPHHFRRRPRAAGTSHCLRAMRRSATCLVRVAEWALANGDPASLRGGAQILPTCFRASRSPLRRARSHYRVWVTPASWSCQFATGACDPFPDTPPSSGGIQFATGLSKHDDLAVAVVECVASVKARLGHDTVPTFLQLMVSADYKNPQMAPKYVMECFTGPKSVSLGDAYEKEATRPALFGATVSGVIGGEGQVMDGFAVSLLAAHLPNTEAVAFHTKDASLPNTLTAEQWLRIATSASSGDTTTGTKTSVATLLLASADFHEIETFASRLHSAAPTGIVVGAVAKPGGVLFSGEGEKVLGDSTPNGTDGDASEDTTFVDVFLSGNGTADAARRERTSHGAVGVVLIGDFSIDAHSAHACRPVGPPMVLTKVLDGDVLELDGRTAGLMLTRILAELPAGEAGMPVVLGLDENAINHSGGGASKKTIAGGSSLIRGRVVDLEEEKEEKQVKKTLDGSTGTRDGTSTGTDTKGEREAELLTPVLIGAEKNKNKNRKKSPAETAAVVRAVDSYAAGGSGFVFRDILGACHETGGVFVGPHTGALMEGQTVQLHVRDSEWGKRRVQDLFTKINQSVPKNHAKAKGAVMFTCVSGNRMHAGDFRNHVTDCPLGGGYVAGEIAPAAFGQRSSLQSHTSVVAVFRESS